MINANCLKHGHHVSWCTTPDACKVTACAHCQALAVTWSFKNKRRECTTCGTPEQLASLAGCIEEEQERFGVHPDDARHAEHLANVTAAEGDH